MARDPHGVKRIHEPEPAFLQQDKRVEYMRTDGMGGAAEGEWFSGASSDASLGLQSSPQTSTTVSAATGGNDSTSDLLWCVPALDQ